MREFKGHKERGAPGLKGMDSGHVQLFRSPSSLHRAAAAAAAAKQEGKEPTTSGSSDAEDSQGVKSLREQCQGDSGDDEDEDK
eukprot:1161091-Pelagomonas_calceolata.AAC.3